MATPTYLANGTQTQYTVLSNVSSNAANMLYTINTITVDNGGANYNYVPQIDIEGGGGYGAQAVATINNSGQVAAITVVNQGIGYSNIADIRVKIRGYGSVGTVIIANSGGGYSNTPTAIFSAPQDPHGITANASLILAQNSIAQVVIGDTGSGYGNTPPTILVTAAQNNYPSYTANLIAILNTGVNAHATANPLPYVTGDPIQGGSYYLRTNSMNIFDWDTSNNFSGNIFVQGTLSSNPLETDWFDIKRLNWVPNAMASNVTGQETIVGKFYWVRARVEDFAAGTINSIKVTYPYNT
jgi:hypothetical protein